jgi:hypothetical protein
MNRKSGVNMSQNKVMVPVLEVANAQLQEYMPSLIKAVDRGCEEYPTTFYVKVLTEYVDPKDTELRQHRFSFYTQKLCPYPDYDQSVFRYNRDKEQVEFVWSIPDEETARHLIANREKVVDEEKELLNFVIAFGIGKLRELCEKWNAAAEQKEEVVN